jgi:hypothetical protein
VVGVGLFKSALAMISNKAKPKTPSQGLLNKAPAAPVVAPAAVVPPAVSPVAPVVAPAAFKSMSAARTVAMWREYPVEAYIRDGGRYHFMINGNFVDSVRCRQYNPHLHTVEYYSLEPLQVRRAMSGNPVTASGSGEVSSGKAGALAEASTPLIWNREPSPEYFPVGNLGKKLF